MLRMSVPGQRSEADKARALLTRTACSTVMPMPRSARAAAPPPLTTGSP